MNDPLFLNRYNGFSSHQRNLDTVMIKKYKIINQIAPPIVNSFFVLA